MEANSWHAMSGGQAAQTLEVRSEGGLTNEEARRRLHAYGPNALSKREGGRWVLRFLAQFKDFMVIALLAAAAISAATAVMHGSRDFLDSFIIAGIVIVNAIVGVMQEGKAERALDALQKLSAPTAIVLRGGAPKKIPVEQVVPGDILILSAGDMVCADARLLESNQLSTQESALTGESMPCQKDAAARLPAETPLADRRNMILSSTMALTGNARAVVTATGMQTEVGKIAGMLSAEKSPQTPLQIRLEKVGRQLSLACVVICALIFLLGFLQHVPLLESFMLAISLAVAAIPEGLPAMVTVVLSIGVQRMAKANAIVRRLPAVETLGCASVICSDKTGTLTQNKMTATDVRLPGQPSREAELRLLRLAALCCNAELRHTGRHAAMTGEPTETAIIAAAHKKRIPFMKDRESFPRLKENPFDSKRKRMSVICRFPETGEAPARGLVMIAKGAPDVLIARCRSVRIGQQEQPMSEALKGKLFAQNEEMAGQALRVIAVATKSLAPNQTQLPDEENLTFLGLIGIQDPPRKEAKAAVRLCKQAGIVPIMITGDHITTANAIAREIGILEGTQSSFQNTRLSMTGAELDRCDDSHLADALKTCRVFARVTPEHKMRIVKALRAQGHVVAMTGDGVNDAPALKAADIGCAMGKGGTEVAKGAADMILTDDNFATIVHAVEAGRGIYDNIKKAVHFLISSNMGEIVAVFFASLMNMPAPLLPIQLLWVNVVTDSAPAIALGMEATDPDVMRQPPKPVNQNFFNKALAFHMALEGLFMGAVTLLAFVLGRRVLGFGGDDLVLGRTMAFTVLSFVEVLHANNMRSERSLLAIGPFSNSRMNFANLLCIGLQVIVVTYPPLCNLFGTVPLNGLQWLVVSFLGLLPTAIMELEKLSMALHRRRARAKLRRKSV
ncbi:MAG: cation-translocating P-type ATPase [Oscillospiraceae bacterium]|jgi:Ca2+-transporting ATPase|nr:cation-translocating P-type ATPase [Oscillospiraceae bacterium]